MWRNLAARRKSIQPEAVTTGLCFTCYFAGGGVQGGRVVGSSDPIGGVPADRPVSPGDLAATVYHSLGFDLHTVLPGPAGRPFPLVDVGKQEIRELF
ncbi:MAG: DUF1501 domain-containing protein [Gimesia chilikensis]